ncbi:MAG: hypothetical protein JF887_07840 [Candidatus Dormibacteraeota bacterium]|uniref:Tetratricopeptide repeat protein n=1 Tax=Candidatus Amunia macphersoniae TaxID=3127014 RepID=A0A934KF47_9BACT|nr:hypothetical protein [Candidatus Dormibacteraeota bacterium]
MKGDPNKAEAVYRRAKEAGSVVAARHLGLLLAERGDAAGYAYLQRADDDGDAIAAHAIAVAHSLRGEMDSAEEAYRRADERGDANAAANLGVILEKRGDTEAAKSAFTRAHERLKTHAAHLDPPKQ